MIYGKGLASKECISYKYIHRQLKAMNIKENKKLAHTCYHTIAIAHVFTLEVKVFIGGYSGITAVGYQGLYSARKLRLLTVFHQL
jgi:hypothetical protein